MATIIVFARNLAQDPGLQFTREGKPFVTRRVLVNRRSLNEAWDWVDEQPTAYDIKVYGDALTHQHDSARRGDLLAVQGLERTERWNDTDSGAVHTRDVLVVDYRFGDVALSLRFTAARTEPASAATQATA